MVFANLVMGNVPRPVFMTFCQQRACVDAPDGVAPLKALRDMLFSNILVDSTACGKDSAFIFIGSSGHPIENITLRNLTMTAAGGGTDRDAAAELAELDLEAMGNHWPEYTCLGATVPAHGIYARHVRGLSIEQVTFRTATPDRRPAVVLVDVEAVGN